MSGRLLTARELAAELGVSAETVLRWTRRGELPGFRLPGGAIRYQPAAIEAWLAEHAAGAAPRGVSATQDSRARAEAYAPISFTSSATPPHDAATTEET